jgi:predicted nucleic acid-binding protein
VTTWLIDKSALVRLAESPDAAEWAARIERGLVRITTVTRLETGYSARSGPEMRVGFQRPPLSSMPVEYLTPAIEDRAVELLTLLADRGQHRAPSIPDLIIAATAELAGLTVLHLDKDFDLVAEITAQPMERLNMDSAAETSSDAEQAEALSFPVAAGAAGQRALPAETFARQEPFGVTLCVSPLAVAAVASGAGGARTHDRRIMRSMASCTMRPSCTDGTSYRTDGTRRAGIN